MSQSCIENDNGSSPGCFPIMPLVAKSGNKYKNCPVQRGYASQLCISLKLFLKPTMVPYMKQNPIGWNPCTHYKIIHDFCQAFFHPAQG